MRGLAARAEANAARRGDASGWPNVLVATPGARRYRRGMAVDPRIVWMPGGVRTEVHLGAEDTDGAFCLIVDAPQAGWSLPPHRHRNEAETIHIIAGEFEIEVDGLRSLLSPGETIHVPRGAIHSGANVGGYTGRRAVLFSPAGMEQFFLQAGAPSEEHDRDIAATVALAIEHGWEFPAS